MRSTSFVLGLVTLVVGCASGSAGTEVASPSSATGPTAARNAKEGARATNTENAEASSSALAQGSPEASLTDPQPLVAALPTTCATEKECVPPKEFAAAACRGHYPSMAIAMFEKHTPWQRLYLKAETLEAVNAYGDRSITAPMVFGEEVLVLRGISRPKAGKLQISSSDIDVLRWDGTCATVARELFSTTRMPNLAQAKIGWRYLEDPFQQALLISKYVATAYEKHRSNCKGSRSSAMDSRCEKATDKLSEAIGIAVRGGLTLPTPAKLPTWATPDQAKAQSAVAMVSTEPQ